MPANFLFALFGIFISVIINWLADHLPSSSRHSWPYCTYCGYKHPIVSVVAFGKSKSREGICPQCGCPIRFRLLFIELVTPLLFFCLPFYLTNLVDAIVNGIHIAILMLIIVIDLEHRLIINQVIMFGLAVALLTSPLVSSEQNSIYLSMLGAVTGYIFFVILYWLAQFLYGASRIPLGFGDVKLAMLMGAMLGFHRVIFALILGIFLGGIISLLLLLFNRKVKRYTALPYGQYLAVAGILMLIFGAQYVQQYWLD